MTGKYVYSFSDDCFTSEEYDTPKEALAAARFEEADAPCPQGHTEVYIGVVGEKWTPTIEGEGIIDMLQEEAYEAGGECAEDYLDGVTDKERDELTEALTKAFNAWAKKHGYEPNFYPVENVKEYKL